MESTLKFVRWLDAFEQENPDKKFASTEQAYLFYCSIENKRSEIDELIDNVKSSGGNSILDENNIALSVEVVTKALTDPEGQYFYLAFCPTRNGSNVMDMGVKSNGSLLAEVLVNYSIQQNQGLAVSKFMQIISKLLLTATAIIHSETAKRIKNN